METRCRLSLVLHGLPRPELQYRVRDELGDHVAWLDMAYQLRHLAELSRLPTVDIQVIPLDTLSYEPLRYAFTVLRFDHDSATDVVYIEMYDNGVILGLPHVNRILSGEGLVHLQLHQRRAGLLRRGQPLACRSRRGA